MDPSKSWRMNWSAKFLVAGQLTAVSLLSHTGSEIYFTAKSRKTSEFFMNIGSSFAQFVRLDLTDALERAAIG